MLLRFVGGRSTGSHPTSASALRSASARATLRSKIASAPNSSNVFSAASLPIAAIQLIELSNRDAVGDRSIDGPKKLSKGTRPAFHPALTGWNHDCTAWER